MYIIKLLNKNKFHIARQKNYMHIAYLFFTYFLMLQFPSSHINDINEKLIIEIFLEN